VSSDGGREREEQHRVVARKRVPVVERLRIDADRQGEIQAGIVQRTIMERQKDLERSREDHGDDGANQRRDDHAAPHRHVAVAAEPQIPEIGHEERALQQRRVGHIENQVIEGLVPAGELVEPVEDVVVECRHCLIHLA
jgi:hypothetical protein